MKEASKVLGPVLTGGNHKWGFAHLWFDMNEATQWEKFGKFSRGPNEMDHPDLS